MQTSSLHLDDQQKSLFFKFLIFIFSLRICFLLFTGFVDDDAYHWSWTQQLDYSYFDHPGMIAWLEWLSTSLFGNTRLGVRLPSFICYLLINFFSWKFVKDLFGEKAAVFAIMMILFVPLWGFGGFVSAPEAPFMVLWVLAAYVFWQGVREDDKRWSTQKTWLLLGLIMGIGFNTKFPIVLIAPGFGLYLLLSPKSRGQLATPWPWLGVLIASLLLAPVLMWNLKYDWPSFKYQFHDRHSGGSFDPKRWLGYIGSQLGLLSPGLYVGVLLTFVTSAFRLKDPRYRLLFCIALPSFLIFYPQPFWADYKPHWMGPVYFLLMYGLAGIWVEGLNLFGRQLIQANSQKLKWSIAGFLIPMNILIYAPLPYPWVPKAFRALAPGKEWVKKNDPSNELFGWPEAGQKALEWQKEIEQATGKKPFMAGHRYEMTGQIWMATQQRTYMLSKTVSHYTVVTTAEELKALMGQDAIMIANDKYSLDPQEFAKFDSCEVRHLPIYRFDELARDFQIYWCKNFQGILK